MSISRKTWACGSWRSWDTCTPKRDLPRYGSPTEPSAEGQHESREVLQEILDHVSETYGLETVHYLLHMHSVPDESVGHLIAKVSTGSPTEVEFTSEEYDEQVKEFARLL